MHNIISKVPFKYHMIVLTAIQCIGPGSNIDDLAHLPQMWGPVLWPPSYTSTIPPLISKEFLLFCANTPRASPPKALPMRYFHRAGFQWICNPSCQIAPKCLQCRSLNAWWWCGSPYPSKNELQGPNLCSGLDFNWLIMSISLVKMMTSPTYMIINTR